MEENISRAQVLHCGNKVFCRDHLLNDQPSAPYNDGLHSYRPLRKDVVSPLVSPVVI